MKIHKCKSQAGFTLLEMIAAFLLSGIVLVFVAMLLNVSTNLFLDGKDASEDSQKIQIAMNRLIKELTFANPGDVTVANSRQISWISNHPDRLGQIGSATWDGNSGSNLVVSTSGFANSILMDNIANFSVSSSGEAITISLTTRNVDGTTLTSVVHPR